MKLNPSAPPGRSNRKARAFSIEMARLAREGYGCRAIQEALAAAGVHVSKSTVQRELARLPKPMTSIVTVAPRAAARTDIDSPPIVASDRPRPVDQQRTGKDIAEAFLRGRITNPLLRRRI